MLAQVSLHVIKSCRGNSVLNHNAQRESHESEKSGAEWEAIVQPRAGSAGALARTACAARSSLRSGSSLLWRSCSRFALNAGEGARAPSKRLSRKLELTYFQGEHLATPYAFGCALSYTSMSFS